MGRRLIFATLSLGVMMACTLVTAHASEYRKDYKGVTLEKATSVLSYTYTSLNFELMPFIAAPDSQFVFANKVTYLFPANQAKPKNRKVNGLINDRREKERIRFALTL
jgi:hypothetical protein